MKAQTVCCPQGTLIPQGDRSAKGTVLFRRRPRSKAFYLCRTPHLEE